MIDFWNKRIKVNYGTSLKHQPPWRVEIKLTLSFASSIQLYLSASSQSTSLIRTSIPGRLWYKIFYILLLRENIYFLELACWFVRRTMSFYTVVPSGTFRLIYVCPSNTKSSPPLKSAFTLIYVAIMFVVIILCVKIWKKYEMRAYTKNIKRRKINGDLRFDVG